MGVSRWWQWRRVCDSGVAETARVVWGIAGLKNEVCGGGRERQRTVAATVSFWL